MLKVGQFCKIKNNLQLGKKYGTVTYSKTIEGYLGRLLKIRRISSTGTAYCTIVETGEKVGTFHELMLDFPKFEINETYEITNEFEDDSEIVKLTRITVGCPYYPFNNIYEFYYHTSDASGVLGAGIFTESCLLKSIKKQSEGLPNLQNLLINNTNENRLQEQENNIPRRVKLSGCRIQGRVNKTSISSRPLRNPKSFRGK
jgi:hypothetical protein